MSSTARTVFSFHGGIHPEEHKLISSQYSIVKAPLPPKLVLPVQQHIGQAADILVEVGQQVLKGELIAEPTGFISAGLHAPTSGTVIDICDHVVPHPSGMSDLCIIIEPDGEDQWCEREQTEHYADLSITEIQDKVRAAGITGMGGAGFPTQVKLHPPRHDKVATLILNAAECEPYITADDRLMRERADEIIQGMEIMAYVLEPGECLIGIEDNKPEAIAALKAAASNTRIEVVVVPTKYPSGGEKQLIKLLTDKEVPSGNIPADIGVVVQNVATAAAVYRAIRFGEPLISRITTLTGEQMGQTGNVEVLIGTPIHWLLEQFDYHPGKLERVIMGGPMMGFTLNSLDMPVVKTTNCLLAPSYSELPPQDPAQACIRCGMCAEACPAELLPQQLYWFARGQEFDKAEHHNLFDCIECGACSYVCPSSIPLVQYYRHAKGEIRKQREDHSKSERARIRFEARQSRIEREAAEKEAKRKARAEAAAKAQAAKKAQAEQAQSSTPSTNAASPGTAAQPAGADDAKKAAIAAALARKQSKAPSAETAPDLDALKDAWDKAQSKLDKMHDALEQAKENTPEQVEKLTRAVEKNQVRVTQAKQAYEQARLQAEQQAKAGAEEPAEASASESADKPDIDVLQANLDKAQAKLDKMIETLEDAKVNQPDNVEKFTRAVEKNKVRVNAAEEALATAKQQLQQATDFQESTSEQEQFPEAQVQAARVQQVQPQATTELPDLEVLQSNLDKAQAKLDKMIDTLEDAKVNQPENVEKFTRAVEKNKVRVNAAEEALTAAKQVLENNSEQQDS